MYDGRTGTDCPYCEGEGGWNEEEHHDYGDTYAIEVVWVECPHCGGEPDKEDDDGE